MLRGPPNDSKWSAHRKSWRTTGLTKRSHFLLCSLASEDENEMQFECPQCDRQFETWFDLVAHCTEHGSSRLPSHGPPASMDGMRPQTMSPEKKRGKLLHKCELCYKAFASEDRLTVIHFFACCVLKNDKIVHVKFKSEVDNKLFLIEIPYILAFKSRNFGQIFQQLIRGS